MDARALAAPVLLALALLPIFPVVGTAQSPLAGSVVTSFGGFVSEAMDVQFDASGDLFISGHQGNSGRIYRIQPNGTTTLYLGGGIATIIGLALGADGSIYAVDTELDAPPPHTGRVIKLNGANSQPTVVAGGLPPLGYIVRRLDGDLIVGEALTGKLDRVTPGGVVTTFASIPLAAGESLGQLVLEPLGGLLVGAGSRVVRVGDGGAPITTLFTGSAPVVGLALAEGGLFVTTGANRGLVFVTANGTAIPLNNVGLPKDCRDGEMPTTASFGQPAGLRVEGGRVYVADTGCSRVRVFDVPTAVPTARTSWGALKAHYH